MPGLPIQTQLRTAEQFYGADRAHPEWSAPRVVVHRFWRGFPPIEEFNESEPAYVFMNWSRWLVACPWCHTATQYASTEDHRFFCVDCGNMAVGGKWIRTVWPNDPQHIERMVGARHPRDRHWDRFQTRGI